MVRRIAAGEGLDGVDARVQRIAIGAIELIALPCEPFCELGIELKTALAGRLHVRARLLATTTSATSRPRASIRFGGYEPTLAQRHYDQPAPFAPEGRGAAGRGRAGAVAALPAATAEAVA